MCNFLFNHEYKLIIKIIILKKSYLIHLVEKEEVAIILQNIHSDCKLNGYAIPRKKTFLSAAVTLWARATVRFLTTRIVSLVKANVIPQLNDQILSIYPFSFKTREGVANVPTLVLSPDLTSNLLQEKRGARSPGSVVKLEYLLHF